MKKITFLQYLWKNGRIFILFCFIFMPLFTSLAAYFAGEWLTEFNYVLLVVYLIWIGSVIGDYFKWLRL